MTSQTRFAGLCEVGLQPAARACGHTGRLSGVFSEARVLRKNRLDFILLLPQQNSARQGEVPPALRFVEEDTVWSDIPDKIIPFGNIFVGDANVFPTN